MSRLTRPEGVELWLKYHDDPAPVKGVDSFTEEEMKDLATGACGAMLAMQVPSVSGGQLGSHIPFLVTMVKGDLIRIFIDPYIQKNGDDHVVVTAFAYSGERMKLDTEELWYAPTDLLVPELVHQIGTVMRRGWEAPAWDHPHHSESLQQTHQSASEARPQLELFHQRRKDRITKSNLHSTDYETPSSEEDQGSVENYPATLVVPAELQDSELLPVDWLDLEEEDLLRHHHPLGEE
jgi:hypothetical protein